MVKKLAQSVSAHFCHAPYKPQQIGDLGVQAVDYILCGHAQMSTSRLWRHENEPILRIELSQDE